MNKKIIILLLAALCAAPSVQGMQKLEQFKEWASAKVCSTARWLAGNKGKVAIAAAVVAALIIVPKAAPSVYRKVRTWYSCRRNESLFWRTVLGSSLISIGIHPSHLFVPFQDNGAGVGPLPGGGAQPADRFYDFDDEASDGYQTPHEDFENNNAAVAAVPALTDAQQQSLIRVCTALNDSLLTDDARLSGPMMRCLNARKYAEFCNSMRSADFVSLPDAVKRQLTALHNRYTNLARRGMRNQLSVEDEKAGYLALITQSNALLNVYMHA